MYRCFVGDSIDCNYSSIFSEKKAQLEEYKVVFFLTTLISCLVVWLLLFLTCLFVMCYSNQVLLKMEVSYFKLEM